MIKKRFITVACSSVLSLFISIHPTISFAENTIAANQQTVDKVVAIINNDVITNSELERQTDKIKQQYKHANQSLPPLQDLRKQILNAMIIDSLQLQIANNNNIEATPEQVNNALDNIAKQNNVNIYDLKKLIERDGTSFDDFKEDLTKQLTIMNIQKAAVRQEMTISKQELEQAKKLIKTQNSKNKYRLSHILISVPSEPDSDKIKFAKKRANELVDKLNQGSNFEKIAKVASDGQQALNGGDLGWFNYAELPSVFTDIVPKLKKGQVYGPIQDESGFHIIKLADAKFDDKKYQETKYKVRHILIKKDDITTDEIAKNELKKLKNEISKNKNFSELALIYSEDHGSASQGGDIGWVNSYDVVPEFSGVMQSLKKNQISEPFESSYGWHIVQLLDKKDVDSTGKVEENQAIQLVEQKKFQDALAKWQNKLKSEAHIKVLI